MFKNYIVVAIRNFRRNKVFSLINVLGLAIGVSTALVTWLIVQHGYSFDKFEKNGDRIFRIVSEYSFQEGNTGNTRGVPAPLAAAVEKELSGIDLTVSFRYYNAAKTAPQHTDTSKPALFKSQNSIIFTGAEYFSMLSYKWLAGSAQTLKQRGRVVLNETRAKLYFPGMAYADLLGRRIVYDDTLVTQVSGVVEDFDKQGNTDFNFKEFISLPTVLENHSLRDKFYWDQWGSTTSDQQLYVRLAAGSTAAATETRLKTIFNKYKGEDAKKNNYSWAYLLQPLREIHFDGRYGNFNTQMANKNTLYGLIFAAAFLLLLGSINFINLTTAQAVQRAKEIGIRKAMGSSRKQLIMQFLSETFVVTLAATLLSVLITPLLLKTFGDFIPEGLHFSIQSPSVIFFLGTEVLAVTILAGFYPAIVLSSSAPIQVLKNQSYSGRGSNRRTWVRQSLTVSQFIIAQFFIMGTLLVSKQIHFMLNKDLGFNKEAILSFNTPDADTSVMHRHYMLERFKKIPGVQLASLGSDVPTSFGWWTSTLKYMAGTKEIQTIVEIKATDTDYLKIYHIPLLAGRDLLSSDTVKEVLINETCLQALGCKTPAEAIGKTVNWDDKIIPITGVIKDFHAHSMSFKIAPMIFCRFAQQSHTMMIALNPSDKQKNTWKTAISGVEKTFKEAYPDEAFSYQFLDESVAQSYSNEQHIAGLLQWTTALTIFISCLGLLGLVIYITNQRTKEIGVRKVLGASIAHIVTILSKDFIKLVAIAFIIVTPVSWWAINTWLQNFVFRTSISWWVFPASGIAMMIVALITLGVQVIRAAMANPVKSLRTE
jgi:hypothetical protein